MRKTAPRGGHRARGDTALWRAAMRDVAPLPGRRPPPEPVEPSPAPPPPTLAKPRAAAVPPPLDRHAGVDRASAQRLQRGLYAVEARLDLHGMTQAEAHVALGDFIAVSRAAGSRCVLVITGQGRDAEAGRPGGGVLKNAVPRWLEEAGLRLHLLAAAPARPRDGGRGALYLLLRKQRSEPGS